MTPQNGSTPKHTTTCRLCQQQWSHATIETVIIGEKPEQRPERIVKFVMELAKHLHKKHGEITTKEMGTTIQDFSGLLIVSYFHTNDPGLDRLTNGIRADIHQKTRKHFVSDDAILDLVSRLGLDSEHEATVAELMRGMRDAYEERGQFSVEKQAEQRVQLA